MHRLILPLAMGLAGIAWAQDTTSYEGNWTAKWTTQNNVPAQGDLVIKGSEGSFQRLGGTARSDPCLFRRAPIAVTAATSDELALTVLRSQALHGCIDFKLTLRRVDEKRLEGSFGGGNTIVLTR